MAKAAEPHSPSLRFSRRAFTLTPLASGLLLCALSLPLRAQQTPVDAELDSVAVQPTTEAQAEPLPEPPRQNGSVWLEEVVVTARKREERLQDVPVSISAFSSDQLDARGIVDVRDLAQAVPGLQFSDLGGYNLIYLRGIGTDIFIPSAEPSVATYLDGVYFPSGHSIAQSFGAIERIEVLKGPQGTLFGRNSTGGDRKSVV